MYTYFSIFSLWIFLTGVTSIARMRSSISRNNMTGISSIETDGNNQNRSHTKVHIETSGTKSTDLDPTRSTRFEVNAIETEMINAEEKLKEKTAQKQRRMTKNTQLRVLARCELRQSKALHKVPAFNKLNDDAISAIVQDMVFKRVNPGTVIFMQDEIADAFYVVTQGECDVIIRDKVVAKVNKLEFFGESVFNDSKNEVRRNASVVSSGKEQTHLLYLKKEQFVKLLLSGVLTEDVIRKVGEVRKKRNEENEENEKNEKKEEKEEKEPGEEKKEKEEKEEKDENALKNEIDGIPSNALRNEIDGIPSNALRNKTDEIPSPPPLVNNLLKKDVTQELVQLPQIEEKENKEEEKTSTKNKNQICSSPPVNNLLEEDATDEIEDY